MLTIDLREFIFDQNTLELTEVIWKLWKFINVFTCVAAVRNTKAKVKVEVLKKTSLEIMSLNHTKTVNGPVSHCELHPVFWKCKEQHQHFKLAAFQRKILISMHKATLY